VLLGAVLLVVALGLAARLLLPLAPLGDPPTVTLITPADGSRDVAPRSVISLRFSQPMNRRAVERALSIVPNPDARAEWRDDGRELVLTPNAPLEAGTTYTLRLGGEALSSGYRALAEPVSVSFRTAPAPSVVAAVPSGANAGPGGPIAVVFSRPMVVAAQVGQPLAGSQLRFSPALSGLARWGDQSTLLFSPDLPLQPATVYTATLDADLADLRGTPLGDEFSWSFSTPPPSLLRRAPEDGARNVAPAQPLLAELSQPVDPAALEAALAIAPPVSGTLSTAISGTGQLLVFTPTLGWAPGTTYRVSLPALAPVAGTLPLPPSAWSFTTSPRLQLVGRFPGQGQLLPPGQVARLIFSSPVNTATLSSGISIDPPPPEPPTFSASGAEVRVAAAFAPSTAYTITLATSIADGGGAPLDMPYRLRLLTAPAPPALAIAGVSGRFVYLPASRPAELLVERTNLAALDMSLYRLDEATLLRAASFGLAEWRDFSPERYNQPQLRAWRVPLDNDQPDQATASPLPIGLGESDASLPPGLYYLRVRSAEGPAADLALVVSSALLTLQHNDRQVLVWASDANGAPLAGVPLALYQGSGLVARGVTGADGLWVQRHSRADGRYFVLAERGAGDAASGAVVSGDWRLGAALPAERGERYRALLLTDRPSYPPTATVQIGGFLRELRGGRVALPGASTPVELALQPIGSLTVLTRTTQLLRSDGVISAALALENAPTGAYLLRARVGGASFVRRIAVAEASPPPLAVELALAADGPQLRVVSPQGQPIAGAQVRWQIAGLPDGEPPAAAAHPGYSFSDEALEDGAPLALSGSGATDADGALPLPAALLSATQRLLLRASVQEPGAPAVSLDQIFDPPTTPLHVGLRLSSGVATAGETVEVELLALDGEQPAAAVPIAVAAQRQGAADAMPQPLGQATSGSDGRARLQVVLPAGGSHRLLARAQRPGGEPAQSARTLWVASADARPNQRPDGPLLLLPDQPSYRPGDNARVLASLPVSRTAALLTLSSGDLLTATVTTLRSDRLLELPIGPQLAPALDLAAVAPALAPGEAFAQARLPVISPTAALNVAIAVSTGGDAASSTVITVTVRDNLGRPVAADLLLSVAEGDGAPEPKDIAALSAPPVPGGIVTAGTLAVLPRPADAAPSPNALAPLRAEEAAGQLAPQVAFWRSGLRSDASGRLTVRVMLPPGPARWRIEALAAAGATRFGSASTTVAAPQPLAVALELPSALVVGDLWPATVALRNHGAQPTIVTATLSLRGLQPAGAEALTRTLRLEPGAEQRLAWPVVTGDAPEASLRVTLETAGGNRRELAGRILVRTPGGAGEPTTTAQAGATVQRDYFDPASGGRLDPSALRAGQLVGVRVSVIVVRPLGPADLYAPLPAGFALVSATPQRPFGRARAGQEGLLFAISELGEGIYTQEYLVRAAQPGRFIAPAPQLALADGQTIVGRSEHAIVE
jgi:hypothetical protein